MKRRQDDIKRNKPVNMKELLRIMASPAGQYNKREVAVFIPLAIAKK